MKKICTIFFITLLLTFSFVVAEASSIQEPALWPAISSITKTENEYIFKVNVRAYCPEGLSGNLLVAAYDVNNKLLDVALYSEAVSITSFINYPLNNCDMTTFLAKTDLAQEIELNLKEKDDVIIRAFVMNFDALTPKIPSGEINFKYNNGDSEVIVNYTLKSDYTDLQLESGIYYFYYYYYYDGKYDSLEINFSTECAFYTDSTFFFTYYNKKDFTSSTKSYYKNELAGKTIVCTEIPGIKIVNYLNTQGDRLSNYQPYYSIKHGFETAEINESEDAAGIKIHCDFGEL